MARQKFQSTPPRRERQESEASKEAKAKFQSTPPRRERLIVRKAPVDAILISIHAPAKGATPSSGLAFNSSVISIHAPAKGATAQSCTVYG